MSETWMHSTDEERWSDYEEYPTREAAIAGAQHRATRGPQGEESGT